MFNITQNINVNIITILYQYSIKTSYESLIFFLSFGFHCKRPKDTLTA